jgi:hypothetical protein
MAPFKLVGHEMVGEIKKTYRIGGVGVGLASCLSVAV